MRSALATARISGVTSPVSSTTLPSRQNVGHLEKGEGVIIEIQVIICVPVVMAANGHSTFGH